METVCDHARALGADAATKFSIALRYHESSDVEPSTSTFGDLSRVAENAAARLRESVERDAGDAMRPMCCGIMVEDGMDLFQCQLAVMFAGIGGVAVESPRSSKTVGERVGGRRRARRRRAERRRRKVTATGA